MNNLALFLTEKISTIPIEWNELLSWVIVKQDSKTLNNSYSMLRTLCNFFPIMKFPCVLNSTIYRYKYIHWRFVLLKKIINLYSVKAYEHLHKNATRKIPKCSNAKHWCAIKRSNLETVFSLSLHRNKFSNPTTVQISLGT